MRVIADGEGAGPIARCLDCSRRTPRMFLSSADSFVLNQWVLHILEYEKMLFTFGVVLNKIKGG